MRTWRATAAAAAVLLMYAVAANAASGEADATSIEALTEDVTVAPDGSFTTQIHSELRANNEAGAMNSSRVSLYFDSETQQIEILEAHTLKKDGTRIPVDVSTIYEQLPADNTLAVTSFRVKILLFPQFATGDTAVYTVRYKTVKPMFAGQFQSGKIFPREIAYKNATVTLTAPKKMALKIEIHDVAFSKEDRGDTVVYRWQKTSPADKSAPQALVSPLDREPRFIVSSFKDYGDLARAYAAQSDPKAAVTEKIRALADQIVAGKTDRREQARLIYEWVAQHVRYVAIELGQGSFVPHDAEAVLAKGYGDCKDHDVLLRALLKAKDIATESVLINGTNAYSLTDAPSFSQLNHVITYVPDFDLYLDASAAVVPFGTLPQEEYGKPAVRTGFKPGIITMPMPKPGTAAFVQTTTEKIAPDGTLSGTTTTTATGTFSAALRAVGYAIQSVGAEKAAELQLASHGYKEGTGKLIADPLTELGDSYTIRGTFSAKGWDDTLKGDSTTIPGGLRLLLKTGDGLMGPFYATDKQANEATMCIGAKASEDISLELPDGYVVRSKPDDETITTPNLTFSVRWSHNGKILKVHREFSSTIDQPLCLGAVRKQSFDALKRIEKSYNETFDLVRSPEHYTAAPIDPKDAEALIDRGVAYETAGNHDKAIADLTAALALKPDNARAARQLAYALDVSGKANEAIAVYTKALALKASDASVWRNRGRLYIDQGNFDLAIADLSKALELEPDNYDFYNDRGRAYQLSGMLDHAVADLKKSVALKPDYAQPHYNLGIVYREQQRLDASMAEFNKAIAIDPGYYWAYWDRAVVWQARDKFELALKDLDKALEIDGNTAEIWSDRSYINLALHNNQAAANDTAKALQLNPHSGQVLKARAYFLKNGGQAVPAIADLTAAIAKDPKSMLAYFDRAYTYLRLKDYRHALADADAMVALQPQMAFSYYTRAQIRHAAGDHKGGNEDSSKALKLEPRLAK